MPDIDWTKIAGPLIGAGATVLGTIVGGPTGAAVGKAAGGVLAEVLGVPATPEAVAEAIENNPTAAKAATDTPGMAAAIAQAQAEIIQTINETYRLELQSESAYVRLARPTWLWCGCAVWTVHGIVLGKALWFRDFDVIRTIPDLTVFYGVMGAIVGVYAWQRSREKIAGTSLPDALTQATGAILKKVGAK